MSVPQAMTQDKPMLLVGRIGAPWGVKGHTRIQSYTNPVANIFEYKNWYIKQKGSLNHLSFSDAKQTPKGLVARLEGIDSRDKAEGLVHCEIYIPKDSLPDCEDGSFYWDDLVSLTVIDQQGKVLGKVDHLYETGAHDNMVVKHDSGVIHIPFVMDHTIIKVDLDAKQIIVDWQEGE